jgi:hypothetical protein
VSTKPAYVEAILLLPAGSEASRSVLWTGEGGGLAPWERRPLLKLGLLSWTREDAHHNRLFATFLMWILETKEKGRKSSGGSWSRLRIKVTIRKRVYLHGRVIIVGFGWIADHG